VERVADLLGFLNGEPADQHPHESSDVESSRNGDHNSGLLKKLPAKRFDASQETGAQEARLSAMQ
jgi:hypothetical protein